MKVCKRGHSYFSTGRGCIQCDKDNKLKWRTLNKELHKTQSKTYYEKFKNERKTKMQLWKSNNLDKCAAISAKRRAAKSNATPSWLTIEQLSEIQQMYSLAKELAWLNQDGSAFHVDHIIPLQGDNVCGLHVPWNLQLLPASENFKKSNN